MSKSSETLDSLKSFIVHTVENGNNTWVNLIKNSYNQRLRYLGERKISSTQISKAFKDLLEEGVLDREWDSRNQRYNYYPLFVGRKTGSILSLQGLGKGIIRDYPEEYLETERDSWTWK